MSNHNVFVANTMDVNYYSSYMQFRSETGSKNYIIWNRIF